MENLIVHPLELSDEKVFLESYEKYWKEIDLSWFTFEWKPGQNFSDYIKVLRNEEQGIELKEGRVPHTMLYGFAEGAIVGRVSIRHFLNDYLKERGGHFGYSVAPTFRKKSYSHAMVAEAKTYMKSIGIDKALVTCAVSNIPSVKVIERAGGILQDRVFDQEHGEDIFRYWIPL